MEPAADVIIDRWKRCLAEMLGALKTICDRSDREPEAATIAYVAIANCDRINRGQPPLSSEEVIASLKAKQRAALQ